MRLFIKTDWGVKIVRVAFGQPFSNQIIMNLKDQCNVFVEHLENINLTTFDALEIHPVKELMDDGQLFCDQCEEDESPDFYTVYAHIKTGGLQALMDCIDKLTAEAIKTLLECLIRAAEVRQFTDCPNGKMSYCPHCDNTTPSMQPRDSVNASECCICANIKY